MKDRPLVSIITPCYNSEKYISKTIESVLAQTYMNWEMIIVDDCSTDDTFKVAMVFAENDKRISVIRLDWSKGAAEARNVAISVSKGGYLAFLDSDDLWLPRKLESQLLFMENHDCDFCFTEYEHIDENGEQLGKKARVIKTLTYEKMLFHDFVGCLTVVYRQDINKKYFGPILTSCNDYALFLKVLKHAKNAMGYKNVLARYRVVNNSLSKNKVNKVLCFIETMTKYENKNLFVSLFYLITNQVLKYFWKYKNI